MEKGINKVKLYVKKTNKASKVYEKVYNSLLSNNFKIVEDNSDLVISIGGDGTFLKMLHENNFDNKSYYASINAGSLGFLSSIDRSRVDDFIKMIKNNKFIIREINPLTIKVYKEKEIIELNCLNELTIRKTDFSSLRCDILVNDKILDQYVGDGIIVNTSIGSTGYNLALGGPIIDRDIKAYSITPIVPIVNSVYKSLTNSFVLDMNKKTTFILNKTNNISIVTDGKVYNIDNITKVECLLSKKTIKCLMASDYDYIKNIKTKIIDYGG